MLTTIEIISKDGMEMANGDPMTFEIECLIAYSIDEGQREITNCLPENAQPGFPPCVEDVQLVSATILYGKHGYPLTKESRWWEIIENMLQDNGGLEDEILEFETEKQRELSAW
jgi:hypothetical protein